MKSDQPAPNLKETRRLVQGLMSRFLGERIRARERLKELGPAGVDALLALIANQQRKLKLRRWLYYFIVATFVLIGLPLAAYIIYQGAASPNPGALGNALGGALGGIIGGWGGGMVGGTVALMFPSQLQIAAAAALAYVDDTRAVGPLAEAVVTKISPSVDSRVAAAEALLRLLPKIKREKYDLLTGHQRSCLYRLLREPHLSKEPELVIAVLETIARVHDNGAFSHAARLAESDDLPQNCHAAAVMCFDILLASRENMTAAESLVRPSLGPEDESAVLLRASATNGEVPEDLLLRASTSDANIL